MAIAYELCGTLEGELWGEAPTDRVMRVRGVQIARYRDGLIVERWGSMDELAMLIQLGLRERR